MNHKDVINCLVRLGEQSGFRALSECQVAVGIQLDVVWLRSYDHLTDAGTVHRYGQEWVIVCAIEAENRVENSKRQKGTMLNLMDSPGERKVLVSWGEAKRSAGTMARVEAALNRHPEIEHWALEKDVIPNLK